MVRPEFLKAGVTDNFFKN